MERLTQRDNLGNWCVKGLPWKDTYVGSLITKNTEEKIHAAFCKLLEYEETGLSPEQVEELAELKNTVSKRFEKAITIDQIVNAFVDFYDANNPANERVAMARLLTNEDVLEHQKLQELNIAKSPDYEGDGFDKEGNIIYDTWICPNCKTEYEVDYEHYFFCPNCGQKIKWSEVE